MSPNDRLFSDAVDEIVKEQKPITRKKQKAAQIEDRARRAEFTPEMDLRWDEVSSEQSGWFRRLLCRLFFKVEWKHRDEPTPDGERIFATDGVRVWEIWGRGKPIEAGATAVKYWARKRIPNPPAPLLSREGLTNPRERQEPSSKRLRKRNP